MRFVIAVCGAGGAENWDDQRVMISAEGVSLSGPRRTRSGASNGCVLSHCFKGGDMNRLFGVRGVLLARGLRYLLALGQTISIVAFFSATAMAETAQDIVASTGCSMAHCNQGQTDHTHLPPLFF
jgi:hypothetical protein